MYSSNYDLVFNRLNIEKEKKYKVALINRIEIIKEIEDIDIMYDKDLCSDRENWLYEKLLELSKDEKYRYKDKHIMISGSDLLRCGDLYRFLIDEYLFNNTLYIDVDFDELPLRDIDY